jgi:hypothetical protein
VCVFFFNLPKRGRIELKLSVGTLGDL